MREIFGFLEMIERMKEQFDLNKDGLIDDKDIELSKQLVDVKGTFVKDSNQARLAWAAMITMVGVSFLLFMPFVPDSRIVALNDILDLFYVAQTSIVGFYIGAKTYLNRKGQ